MASRRRRHDGEAWIVIEVRAPRWAVWCVAVGALLVGAAGGAAAVAVVWAAVR